MTTQIESLVYVGATSLGELKTQVAGLEGADPRTIDARLRQLESTATTLSSALSRLAQHMDSLPAEHPDATQKGPRAPEDDGGLLLSAAQRLAEIMTSEGVALGSEAGPTTEMRAARRAVDDEK